MVPTSPVTAGLVRLPVTDLSLLRRLVSCGRYRTASSAQTRRGYSCYICIRGNHQVVFGREERCYARLIPVREVNAAVWTDLCALLTTPGLLTQAPERAQRGAWEPQKLQARSETVARAEHSVTTQIERLTTAYLEQSMEFDEYGQRRHELEEQAAFLERQRRSLEAIAAGANGPPWRRPARVRGPSRLPAHLRRASTDGTARAPPPSMRSACGIPLCGRTTRLTIRRGPADPFESGQGPPPVQAACPVRGTIGRTEPDLRLYLWPPERRYDAGEALSDGEAVPVQAGRRWPCARMTMSLPASWQPPGRRGWAEWPWC